MKISVVILTKNEEKNIAGCIDSVSFADEILVIDDKSTDSTVKFAKELGSKLFVRKLNSDFAEQRNYGLEKAKGKWVLFIDADERISRPLRDEIIQVINNPTIDYSGFYFKRADILWGQVLKHGEAGSVKLLRLARRNAGKWTRRVHEVWNIEGDTYDLSNPIMHYSHPTVRDFISHINTYSSLHAKANKDEGKNANIFKVVIWPVGKFSQNYFLKLGFLDGMPGFVSAMIMSFSSFLAWSKIWQIQKTN